MVAFAASFTVTHKALLVSRIARAPTRPYTNLAAALHRDATALRKIQRVYAEGGRLDLAGVFPWNPQNKPPTASWNVFLDTIAAAQVYAFGGFPITLFADNACHWARVVARDLWG
eukprot:Skav207308  [mRNA]  locus=scaffold533:297948:301236:+ [translate_table: standard]